MTLLIIFDMNNTASGIWNAHYRKRDALAFPDRDRQILREPRLCSAIGFRTNIRFNLCRQYWRGQTPAGVSAAGDSARGATESPRLSESESASLTLSWRLRSTSKQRTSDLEHKLQVAAAAGSALLSGTSKLTATVIARGLAIASITVVPANTSATLSRKNCSLN